MQILRLLAARRAAYTNASAASARRDAGEDDEGPFFDLDFSSVRASSFSSSGSDSDSDESCSELDFIISIQRSRSATPLYFPGAAPPQLKFCDSEPPPARAYSLQSQQHRARKPGISTLRTLSFGARKAAPLYGGGRHSFARSCSGRRSSSSARSLRLFLDSPPRATDEDEHHATERASRRAPSRDVIRRCLAKISRRLRTAAASPRAAETRGGLRRLRKCRSAPSAAVGSVPARRGDDSAVEKQDGIAGAIAHCKESLHRASTSECGSPLVRVED